jgi:hypothetical protein
MKQTHEIDLEATTCPLKLQSTFMDALVAGSAA